MVLDVYFKMNLMKWIPIIIVGLLIAAFDYYMLNIWAYIVDKNYMCIKTSDGLGEFCAIMWDVNPSLLFILSFISIIITLLYILIIFDMTGLLRWRDIYDICY